MTRLSPGVRPIGFILYANRGDVDSPLSILLDPSDQLVRPLIFARRFEHILLIIANGFDIEPIIGVRVRR